MFSFSGFGTLGLVHSSEKHADFTSSQLKPDGAGYSHNWSADVDSLIGGQVTARFTPKLSAVVQVIAEQNYDNSYRPHVEWANLQYQFTPEFSVRRRAHGAAHIPVFRNPQGGLHLSVGAPATGGLIDLYRLLRATALMPAIARMRVDFTTQRAGQFRQQPAKAARPAGQSRQSRRGASAIRSNITPQPCTHAFQRANITLPMPSSPSSTASGSSGRQALHSRTSTNSTTSRCPSSNWARPMIRASGS